MTKENIFLIGYRGTGKTAVAQILAERLGWVAIDADALLEERHGRSIAAIFAENGEAGFRDKEESILEELCAAQYLVVATGGGVILREANRLRLRAAGRVVWLTADAETLHERIEKDGTTRDRRPTLTVGGLAEIKELLAVREPLYRACADEIIATPGRSPADIATQILSRMG